MSSSDHVNRLRFFGQWLANPRQTAAITPSSPDLVAAVMAELPDGAQRIIELGAGTGVFTRALLERGIRAADLLVVELNPVMHANLAQQFPDAHVVQGNAIHLVELGHGAGFLQEDLADAVVSGLGLLAMDRATQSVILQAAFECLRPGGVFVQFTYGPLSPVPEQILSGLGISARRGTFVLRNVPPATVWVFTRSRAKGIKPRTVRRDGGTKPDST